MRAEAAGEEAAMLRSRVAALEELLQVHEQAVLEQAGKLEKALEELTRSNRELKEFAYVASHDLQEPLRKILAFGDRLQASSRTALGEEGVDSLDRMRGAAGRMQALISDLLAYAQLSTGRQDFQQVDLGRAAREVLSDLEVLVGEARARVEVGELPTIEADPTQMRQLLQNLLGNALKFRRPGVEAAVRVQGKLLSARAARPPGISASARRLCQFQVEDNGIGFDEKHLDRIFGIFQRLHPRSEYQGTGVGLAICRKIVERHGGAITARSSPGNGAVFIVTLPIEQRKG